MPKKREQSQRQQRKAVITALKDAVMTQPTPELAQLLSEFIQSFETSVPTVPEQAVDTANETKLTLPIVVPKAQPASPTNRRSRDDRKKAADTQFHTIASSAEKDKPVIKRRITRKISPVGTELGSRFDVLADHDGDAQDDPSDDDAPAAEAEDQEMSKETDEHAIAHDGEGAANHVSRKELARPERVAHAKALMEAKKRKVNSNPDIKKKTKGGNGKRR